MEIGAGAVDGFCSFEVCGGFFLRRLPVVCLEEISGMFVDNVVSFKATKFINDVVE